jgi:hypothetical protein
VKCQESCPRLSTFKQWWMLSSKMYLIFSQCVVIEAAKLSHALNSSFWYNPFSTNNADTIPPWWKKLEAQKHTLKWINNFLHDTWKRKLKVALILSSDLNLGPPRYVVVVLHLIFCSCNGTTKGLKNLSWTLGFCRTLYRHYHVKNTAWDLCASRQGLTHIPTFHVPEHDLPTINHCTTLYMKK